MTDSFGQGRHSLLQGNTLPCTVIIFEKEKNNTIPKKRKEKHHEKDISSFTYPRNARVYGC